MLAGVELVKLGLLDRLAKRYQPVYGNETADLLAASMVNEIFSHQPSDYVFCEFSESNKETIKREIGILMQDKDISQVIHQAVRVQVQVAQEQNQHRQEATPEPTERGKEFGLLPVCEEILTPQAFLALAQEFHQGRS